MTKTLRQLLIEAFDAGANVFVELSDVENTPGYIVERNEWVEAQLCPRCGQPNVGAQYICGDSASWTYCT